MTYIFLNTCSGGIFNNKGKDLSFLYDKQDNSIIFAEYRLLRVPAHQGSEAYYILMHLTAGTAT